MNTIPRSFLPTDSPRVWTSRRGDPNIIMYCHGSIWIGHVPPAQQKEAVDQFHLGASPPLAIGNTAREIALVSVDQAEADLKHRTFTFKHSSHLGTAKTSFQMASVDDMNELIGIVKAQLGSGFTAAPIGLDLMKLFGLPLAILVAAMAAIGGLWYVTRPGSGIMHRNSMLERTLMDLGNHNLELIAGGVLAIIGLWALLRLVFRPSGLVFRRVVSTP